mgnify:CR=1 FL=1
MRILAKEEAKFIDQWAVEKGGLPLAVLMEKCRSWCGGSHCGSI